MNYLDDYDYDLDPSFIAQCPSEKRDQSKLLLLDKDTGEVKHHMFSDIIDFLRPGDLLVRNNSKVFPARLFGNKETGARVEFLLLNPLGDDMWQVMSRPAKKIRVGDIIRFSDDFSAEVIESGDEGKRIIRFSYENDFWEALEVQGEVPLPPYIDSLSAGMQPDEIVDRYQTVYAKDKGSSAAPTAGLHFTDELFSKLESKGISIVDVTLHVGPGTFQPVKVDDLSEHKMHSEFYSITKDAVQKIKDAKKNGQRIIAVGTTSVRVLESIGDGILDNSPQNYEGETSIFIYPPYQFKIVDALITNFHLPKSTLLMLVSSLASRESILNAYNVAIENNYRFFSFGDAMFIS